MQTTKPSIVFFGSGPVAAMSLALLEKNFEIEAVITKPTTVHEMDVLITKKPIFSVATKTELDNLIQKEQFTSSVGVLIDFGIIVSKNVINYFSYGIVNSHFSLLPEWRGADPITFSILSGQAKTGVSLMVIDESMDTGKLIGQKSLPIPPDTDSDQLTNQLVKLSNEMLADYLVSYLNKSIKPRSQPHPSRATYSRKLTKQDGILDFTKSAEVLEREVRAYSNWPKSRTQIAGKDVIITDASIEHSAKGKPGVVYKTSDKKIGIYCATGALIIETLKPAGKQTMPSKAFLAGHVI